MKKILLQYIDEFKTELDSILGVYKEYKFNTSRLPDSIEYTLNRNICHHPAFETMFDELQNTKSNCLYWLSVDNIEDAKKLKVIISDKKTELWNEDKTKCRVLPARNKNENTTIIYVGVRKGSNAKTQKISNIAGRIIQHLGYYKEGRTQGLQLAYYARDLDINLTLHLYSLHNCPDEYLYILEKIFAKKLQPICGTH